MQEGQIVTQDERSDRFSDEQLAQLIGIAVDGDTSPTNDPVARMAALLHDRLSGPLPMETTVVEAMPVLLGRLRQQLLPYDGQSVRALLLDKETEIGALKSIKEYGKELGGQGATKGRHAVGSTIYHAAIASGLLFHGEKISSFSYEDLAAALRRLIEMPWLPPDLARHFAKARKMCRRRVKRGRKA